MLEESAGEEDVATGEVDSGAVPPSVVCGPCLACGGGLRTILGGGFSRVRIYHRKEANISDTSSRPLSGG